MMLSLHWQDVSKLNNSDDNFIIEDILPENLTNNQEILIGKTKEIHIPKNQWSQIKDKQAQGDYAKKTFVDSYFTTSIYLLKRIKNLSLVGNKTYRETIDINHTSSFRNSQTTNLRIENTIEATGNADFGSLRDSLTVTYNIDRMEEYYTESRNSKTKEIYYESTPYTREIVFWDLIKIVALYRKDKKGNIELIAFNDFLVSSHEKTYITETNE